MEHKYMRISHEKGKTVGIKSYSNDETTQTYEARFPKQFEVFQQGETIGRETFLTPAKLKEGYYPIEDFEKLPSPMANFVSDGEAVEARTLLHAYIYVGSIETKK